MSCSRVGNTALQFFDLFVLHLFGFATPVFCVRTLRQGVIAKCIFVQPLVLFVFSIYVFCDCVLQTS